MSMISPKTFIELECKGKTYKELTKIRDELIKDIFEFEKGKMTAQDYRILPSPETVYEMNLEYLGELCRLISETYAEETAKEDEERSEDCPGWMIRLLIRNLRAEGDGYTTTTWQLLRDTGFDVDKFDEAALMKVFNALSEAADKEGLILDMSAHDGKLESLFSNLDFIVRRKES